MLARAHVLSLAPQERAAQEASQQRLQQLYGQLYEAAASGTAEEVKQVVQQVQQAGGSIEAADDEGWPALLIAVHDKNRPAVRALLAAGADPDASCQCEENCGITALHLAANNCDVESARMLLHAGAFVWPHATAEWHSH